MERIEINVITGEQTVIKMTDEEIAALPTPDPNDAIRIQISVLEASITTRRLREATLGNDNGWLADIDGQIAALRGKLS